MIAKFNMFILLVIAGNIQAMHVMNKFPQVIKFRTLSVPALQQKIHNKHFSEHNKFIQKSEISSGLLVNKLNDLMLTRKELHMMQPIYKKLGIGSGVICAAIVTHMGISMPIDYFVEGLMGVISGSTGIGGLMSWFGAHVDQKIIEEQIEITKTNIALVEKNVSLK